MATQASLNLVQYAYIAFYGRPADLAGQEYWAEQLDTNGGDLAGIIDAFSNSPEYDAQYGDLTNEELVAALYQQILGREADAEGLAYYVGELESGARTKGAIALDILNGPLNNPEAAPEDAATLANRKAVADQFTALVESEGKEYGEDQLTAAKNLLSAVSSTTDTDNVNVAGTVNSFPAAQEGTGPSVEGETFVLTEGRDNFTGTENDDTFIGMVGQNQNGAISNAFATGDVIDGGAGRDKIEASMISDNEVGNVTNSAPRPVTRNVEEVFIEALEDVTLDATRMEGVEEFWSDFSRGDMTFTGVNLRGSNLNITKDVTFGIKDTMDETNFTALFDSLSLTREAASQSNSQLLVRIADVSTETPEAPLTNVNLNLSFDLGEDTITLENVRSTDGSYAGLVTAINNALALEGYANLTVELSTPYSDVTFAGNTVNLPFVAQEILITDPAGNEFDNINFTQSAIQPVAGGFLVAGNASAVPPGASSNLIESNLVLDNAGNGSQAGDVVIGGMSNSDLGVERFNVFVDRSSDIRSLSTTNLDLQEIHIASIENENNAGNLSIGMTQANLNEIDANAFTGQNLSLGEVLDVQNLAFLDASGTSANVTFEGFNWGGLASVIQTGSGNDNIELFQFGISNSGSTPTSVDISSTGGNNTIELSSDNSWAAGVAGLSIDNTAAVRTGAGNDTITGGANSLTVNSGAGDDAIYAENTGVFTTAFVAAGSTNTTFGAPVTTPSTPTNTIEFVELLNGRTLQVTLAAPDVLTTTGVATDAAAFDRGFETTVTIEARDGVITDVTDLHNAVARAINTDPVMNKLATASVDSNGHLTVSYIIDGVTVATNDMVSFEVVGDWAGTNGLPTAQLNNLVDALKAEYRDSAITAAALETLFNTEAKSTAGPANAVGTVTAQTTNVTTPATPAVVTFDLASLVAANVGDTLDFDIDGTTFSLTAGSEFAPAPTIAGVAAQLDGLVSNGFTFELVGGSVITLTSAPGGTTYSTTLTDSTVTDATAASVDATSVTNGTASTTSTTAGTDSLDNGGANIVNAGLGNDVIVLSSAIDRVDTVVFEGQFGHNTIVHFNDAANGDVLDFSAWLDNVTDVSTTTGTESERRIDGDVVDLTTAAGAIKANEVAVTTFDILTNATAATLDFDALTGAQVLTALNESLAADFTADAAIANFVGNTQNSILMVENWDGAEGNQGEYKVFQVSSETGAGDTFTAVTLVGTVDFGASLDTASMDTTNIV